MRTKETRRTTGEDFEKVSSSGDCSFCIDAECFAVDVVARSRLLGF